MRCKKCFKVIYNPKGKTRDLQICGKCIEFLKKEKYTIIALEITNNSTSINNLKISNKNKTAIIIGNENYGVSKNLLSIANHTTHIEMFGKNSSMNLAQATAICLYEVTNNYQL